MLALLLVLPGTLYIVFVQGLTWMCGGDRPWFARITAHGMARLRSRVGGRLRPVTTHLADGFEEIGVVRRRRSEPVPTVLLVLELRRLAAEVRRIEADDQPHPAARLAAALAAYDHVLVQLCSQAQLPTPIGLLPLDPRDRLDLEADLVSAGVDW